MTLYAIIEWNVGDDEGNDIGGRFASFTEAIAYRDRQYDRDEIEALNVQIMKVLPDGSFTTEF